MSKLNQQQLQLVVEKCTGASLDAIWEMLGPIHQGWTLFPSEVVDQFSARREIFLWILARLLREKHIKLHKNGVFLVSSVEKQVEAFCLAFPASEEEADRQCTKPGYEPAYEGFGMNVWWFLDICPAGVAWRMPDGSYQIAD